MAPWEYPQVERRWKANLGKEKDTKVGIKMGVVWGRSMRKRKLLNLT